jgi:hypothetical protein
MRWMFAVVLASAGCGDSGYDGCRNPCPGSTTMNYPIYVCDGGPCTSATANPDVYWQCLCTVNGVTHSFAFRQPTADDCSSIKDQWKAFAAATCK